MPPARERQAGEKQAFLAPTGSQFVDIGDIRGYRSSGYQCLHRAYPSQQ
jgi:hypothetical protein